MDPGENSARGEGRRRGTCLEWLCGIDQETKRSGKRTVREPTYHDDQRTSRIELEMKNILTQNSRLHHAKKGLT